MDLLEAHVLEAQPRGPFFNWIGSGLHSPLGYVLKTSFRRFCLRKSHQVQIFREAWNSRAVLMKEPLSRKVSSLHVKAFMEKEDTDMFSFLLRWCMTKGSLGIVAPILRRTLDIFQLVVTSDT